MIFLRESKSNLICYEHHINDLLLDSQRRTIPHDKRVCNKDVKYFLFITNNADLFLTVLLRTLKLSGIMFRDSTSLA